MFVLAVYSIAKVQILFYEFNFREATMRLASLNTCKTQRMKQNNLDMRQFTGRLENLAGLRKAILNKQFKEVLLAPSYNSYLLSEMKKQLIELYRGQAYLHTEVKGPFLML